MIYTLLVGLGGTSEIINNATSDAEKAGAVIGTGLGLITIGSLWVIGDIIIGILVFLTKPKDNKMKNIIFSIGASFISISVLPVHAATEHNNFNAVLQCRAIENNKDRLSCYDKSIQPTRTKVAEKFESRDQCPDEKDDDRRLSCYDRFFLQHLLHL